MIAIWTYRDERTGFSQVAHALARELSRDEEVAFVEWGSRQVFARWRDGVRSGCDGPVEDLPPGASIGVGNIDELNTIGGHPRIGYVAPEGTRIPTRIRRGLQRMDHLWTATGWGRRLLERAGFAPDRIHVVPHGVDTELFQPGDAPRPGPFRFLSVGKWERRKGFDILLRCFDEVFGGSREVELVVHCGAEPDDAARQRALNVRFSAERSRSEMPPLYQSADCFVLTTRAEAWGLPISEAMSCGVPPIVTDYSGPTEFVHEGVGYPVRVRGMSFLKDPVFYPTAWHRLPSFGRWAEPDPAHVRARLRQAVDEPDGRRARGVAARLEMVERWTWQRAGERARQCLDEHRGLHGKRSHTE